MTLQKDSVKTRIVLVVLLAAAQAPSWKQAHAEAWRWGEASEGEAGRLWSPPGGRLCGGLVGRATSVPLASPGKPRHCPAVLTLPPTPRPVFQGLFFFKDFIYLLMRDTLREAET